MNTLNTLDLVDLYLNYFTGEALGHQMMLSNDGVGPAYTTSDLTQEFTPSTDRRQALVLIERMRTVLAPWRNDDGITCWSARAQGCEQFATGETVLIAMCRALVLLKFGPTVTLPSTAPPPDPEDCADLFG